MAEDTPKKKAEKVIKEPIERKSTIEEITPEPIKRDTTVKKKADTYYFIAVEGKGKRVTIVGQPFKDKKKAEIVLKRYPKGKLIKFNW